ncbi:MAG TPA: thioredoxin-dependent thiol peroxidase [Candidatus Nanoarchaeia archaeon]|nr:thioredoxin-dependent thiol peroxidase [Candidatus Nanoarchaeia archaeon]
MINLKIGDKAPNFNLKDGDGKTAKLSDFKGKKVVLYFYPKDDTSGCTKEACNFRDNLVSLKKLNVEVLGVSNDDEMSHKKFAEKYKLTFRLLADVDKKVSKEYGVYELKNNYGKEYYGITRSTFVIDENGKIQQIYYKVNPEEHINELMAEIKK